MRIFEINGLHINQKFCADSQISIEEMTFICAILLTRERNSIVLDDMLYTHTDYGDFCDNFPMFAYGEHKFNAMFEHLIERGLLDCIIKNGVMYWNLANNNEMIIW